MEHKQVRVGNVALHVAELGSGPAVLFCHGFPDLWIGWRRQMEALAEAGYRAIALDMRGYGRSSAPDDPLAYTPLHAIGDLVGLMDVLGLPSAAIVGHDFGAAVAWYAALLRPDRFHAVFAISLPFPTPGQPSLFEAMKAAGKEDSFYMFRQREPEAVSRWADAATSYPGFLYWSSGSPPPEERWDPLDTTRDMCRPAPVDCPPWADPGDIAYAVAEFERTGFTGPLSWYRSLQLFSDTTKCLTGMKVERPAAFLWGDVDGVTRIRAIDENKLRADVPGLIDAVCLKGVGHWPHREKPEAVNTLLLQFLESAF
jgi:pimeloyl-ACP methyl ester carboxylesterase